MRSGSTWLVAALGLPSLLACTPRDGRGTTVPAALEQSLGSLEYGAATVPGGMSLSNPAQDLRATFTSDDVRLTPRAAPSDGAATWTWDWRTIAWGRDGAELPAASAAPRPAGSTVRYERGALAEWYVNQADGIEQGFTLRAAPPGHGWVIIRGAWTAPRLRADWGGDGSTARFVDTRGATALRYGGLVARDAHGSTLPTSMRVTDSHVALLVDDRAATYPIVIDPVMQTPAWTFETNQMGSNMGDSVATAGDVNGDGFSDVIVAAPFFDNGEFDEGKVFVFYGSNNGLPAFPSWTAEGNQSGAGFGVGVASAGDVNGDGYADVIIGAYKYDNGQTDEGRAFVYYGGPNGLADTPAWTGEPDQDGAWYGNSVGSAGDVNGDGYDDILVGAPNFDAPMVDSGRAYLYLGGPNGPAQVPSWFRDGDQVDEFYGAPAAGAGDIDADGYSDIIVGSWRFGNGEAGEGRAELYLGGPDGPSNEPAWSREGNQPGASFAHAVNAAGDVNGDGCADVIVGASRYSNGEPNEGRAFLYLGRPWGLDTTATWVTEANAIDARWGCSAGTAGDVNGDGYADVIVGSWNFDNGQTDEGRASVFLGGPEGLDSVAVWTAESNQQNANTGWSVGTAGDVNGDGYSDVIVGTPRYDNGQTDEGRAAVFLGSSAGLDTVLAWSAATSQAASAYGASVAGAGDLNGDGYCDVLVGCPRFDNGQTDEGRGFLYFGSRKGPVAPGVSIELNQTNMQLGATICSAGDVNDDGYCDILIAAPFFDNGEQDEGGVFLFLGSPTGISDTPDWAAEGNQTAAQFGASISRAGDVNGDGYGDVIIGAPFFDNGETDEGRVYLYYGTPLGLASTPAWVKESNQAGANYGGAISTAGDVNGDGYGDVIIGAKQYDNGQLDEGRAVVFLGSATGLDSLPDWSAEINQVGAAFGASVADAGDVNRDGYSDVVVGAPFYDNGPGDEGRAVVFYGSPNGLGQFPAWGFSSAQPNANFGASVAGAGDINNDGASDIIVGAPFADIGQTNEGQAYCFLGSPTGLPAQPSWTRRGEQARGNFGNSVSGVGDVNGDGYSDVLVGAISFDVDGHLDGGQAFLFYGNGSGLERLPQQARSDDTAPIWESGISDDFAGFRIRAHARSAAGRARVWMQYEVQPYHTPFDGSGLAVGPIVDTAFPDTVNGSTLQVSQLVQSLASETTYHWRMRFASRSPNFPHTPWFTPSFNASAEADIRTANSVAVGEPPAPPATGWITGITPNPMTHLSTIAYRMPATGDVRLRVLDVRGREVARVEEGRRAAGPHLATLDASGPDGRRVPAGVYILEMTTAAGSQTRPLVVLR